ncbi:Membrane protein of ER body-like protein [Zea mays]|uniref:Membrane protein of ER body-like protein n=1 Tax=Zea mays TaxID=4577 RepID=A0A1D6LJ76_MAIZE|nr:Membrane protein of ER body-like protein [Zea mays]
MSSFFGQCRSLYCIIFFGNFLAFLGSWQGVYSLYLSWQGGNFSTASADSLKPTWWWAWKSRRAPDDRTGSLHWVLVLIKGELMPFEVPCQAPRMYAVTQRPMTPMVRVTRILWNSGWRTLGDPSCSLAIRAARNWK